ncbi:MAG: PstS family phosphate ABC transporter substrate-binding protein [Polyangiales bacterium]
MISTRRWFLGNVLALSTVTACKPKNNAPAPAPTPAPSAAPVEPDLPPFRCKGSDTMQVLVQAWSDAYRKSHANQPIQLEAGGSGKGIAALIAGATDLCLSSRPLSDGERAEIHGKRGADAVETKVAMDGLSIFVNEKNRIRMIDLPQLTKVLSGQITNWKDIGGGNHKIDLYGRDGASGSRAIVKARVLVGKDFASDAQERPTTSAIVAAIKDDEFGIGYGGVAYGAGVHALSLKREPTGTDFAPKAETVKDGSYLLTRPLFIYTAGEPTKAPKAFLDWILSDAGQAVVTQVGYFPLPK